MLILTAAISTRVDFNFSTRRVPHIHWSDSSEFLPESDHPIPVEMPWPHPSPFHWPKFCPTARQISEHSVRRKCRPIHCYGTRVSRETTDCSLGVSVALLFRCSKQNTLHIITVSTMQAGQAKASFIRDKTLDRRCVYQEIF